MAKVKLLRTEGEALPPTRRILQELRRPIGMVGLFSGLISLLILSLPLYMMNLFDRVLTSLSVPTLVALTVITLFLLSAMGVLEVIRSRLLNRLSVRFDEAVNRHVFDALFLANLQQRLGGATLGQIDIIRSFITGPGLTAFFDVPFIPLFLLVLFLLHPILGTLMVLSMGGIVALALFLEWKCKGPMRESTRQARRAARFADNSMRNAEVIAALGMLGNLRRRWHADHQKAIDSYATAADSMATVVSSIKAANFLIQVILLAVACYLVIDQTLTPGALFATNILAVRVIGPLQQAMTGWRGFNTARESFQNLDDLLQTVPEEMERLKLPAPEGRLLVEKLVAGAPGGNQPIIKGMTFKLEAGESLGIIGPSGGGKSTLARLLVGVWKPYAGAVRLDDAEVHSWDFDDLGPHIGYLPQDIELFDGTVADNICRFGPRDDAAIIAAALKVGLHKTILQLPQGYDTTIGGNRGMLSGGQRQRLGLARALYGDPKLVVLDEPNSNLDNAGEEALMAALAVLKKQGKTVVVISHKPRILKCMDKILFMRDGKLLDIGAPDKVLAKVKLIPRAEGDGEEAGHAPAAAS